MFVNNRVPMAYAAIVLAIVALDVLWLGVVASGWYQQAIGHLMAAQPRWEAAVAFYLVYAAGLLIFVVAPQAQAASWTSTLLYGGLFGLVAYATYDLSNLATLKDWPLGITVLDIAWGATLSAAASLAGRWAYRGWGG